MLCVPSADVRKGSGALFMFTCWLVKTVEGKNYFHEVSQPTCRRLQRMMSTESDSDLFT